MPLYEYECTTCHRRTEKIMKYSDAELTICPHCGGPLERTITAPAFQFAGGGWYKDGYGNAKPPTGSNDVPSVEAAAKASSGDSGSGNSGSKDSGSKDSGTSSSAEASKPAAAPAAAASTPAAKP
jgi:putative FmdB family regulatory protein